MLAPIEADYVVIGSGATGMAFADTLIQQTDATVAIIDRHHRPGGHWNDAYPFIRLHLPSHYYGVASTPLGTMDTYPDGLNAGLLHMASGPEILAYYERVMDTVLRASGRVSYHPMHSYNGAENTATSLLDGTCHPIVARKRRVDATFSNTRVPLTHTRSFTVADDVTCVPINNLATIKRPWSRFCIVGSGKTGVDACLWLLAQGVAPDRIRWIMPKAAWWIDRSHLQLSDTFFESSINFLIGQMEAASQATSFDDLFLRFEAAGLCLRLDPTITPTIYPSTTVTPAELHELRRIRDVVRLGRVHALQANQIDLERGSLPAQADCLYVDCSAAGLTLQPSLPIWDQNTIRLQLVRLLRPCLSAAAIAYIETHFSDDAEKNTLCAPVPYPRQLASWGQMVSISMANQAQWAKHPALTRWATQCRLDGVAALMTHVDPSDATRLALVAHARAASQTAAKNLPRLLAGTG